MNNLRNLTLVLTGFLFVLLVVLFSLSGCAIKSYVAKNGFTQFMEECPYKQVYREWGIVNGRGLLVGNGIASNGFWLCGYSFEKIDEEKLDNVIKSWFPYTTRRRLERRWQGKPMPKGMADFIIRWKYRNFYDDFNPNKI